MCKGKEQAQQGKRERERERRGVGGGLGRRAELGAVSSTRTGPFRAGLIFFFFTGLDHFILFYIYLSPKNYTKYVLFIIKNVF